MGKREIGERALRMRGWTMVGETPPDPIVVFIAAPHTSNHDLMLMLWMTWSRGVHPRFLLKKEAFRGPAGVMFRTLGGISVDRDVPGGLVEELVAEAKGTGQMAIVIAPEGTRGSARYWKSGFYRIAQALDVPICLAWCDGPTKTVGFGPTIKPTGDVRADMDVIRAFYADKRGVNPERRTEPRLREEDEPATEPR